MRSRTKPRKHYTASVIILNKEVPTKTLLLHHPKLGKWMYAGGHQEDHENPVETAIRESREETGLDISDCFEAIIALDGNANLLPLPRYILEERIAAHGSESSHYHTDIVYTVRVSERAVAHTERESNEINWFTVEELDSLPMFENLRVLLKQEMGAG